MPVTIGSRSVGPLFPTARTAHTAAVVAHVPSAPGAVAHRRVPAGRPFVAARRSPLLLTAGLLAGAAALVTTDVLADGALPRLDGAVDDWNLDGQWPGLRPLARVLVVAGQRGPVLLVVAVVVTVLALRQRSWRPLVLPAAAVVALNVIVGTMKVAIGRTAPYSGRDDLFAGGTLFPSGHSANSVVMWGALAVVLMRCGCVRRRWPLVTAVAGISVVVGVASVLRDTHWVSDVLAGWLIGGALLTVLAMTVPPTLGTEHARKCPTHRPGALLSRALDARPPRPRLPRSPHTP